MFLSKKILDLYLLTLLLCRVVESDGKGEIVLFHNRLGTRGGKGACVRYLSLFFINLSMNGRKEATPECK